MSQDISNNFEGKQTRQNGRKVMKKSNTKHKKA